MVPIAASFSILFAFLLLMLNICDGAKQWSRPADGKAKLVKGNDDVQTIVFESPTDGVWEIGNGQIWHKPIGGGPVNKTAEFDPIPTDYIEKKMKELTGGSIRIVRDTVDSIQSIRNKRSSGGGGAGSIRPAAESGSIRPQTTSTCSIRGDSGKKKWTAPSDSQPRLAKDNDGVQTIVFESPTDGVWEIGNGEIWHKPIDRGPLNKTAEFKPLPTEYIEWTKRELTGGSIRNEGVPGISIRPNLSGSIHDTVGTVSSGSIRDTAGSAGAISVQESFRDSGGSPHENVESTGAGSTHSGSIRDTVGSPAHTGSIRDTVGSVHSGSIRPNKGKIFEEYFDSKKDKKAVIDDHISPNNEKKKVRFDVDHFSPKDKQQ